MFDSLGGDVSFAFSRFSPDTKSLNRYLQSLSTSGKITYDGFILTDPVVQSQNGRFGPMDLAMQVRILLCADEICAYVLTIVFFSPFPVILLFFSSHIIISGITSFFAKHDCNRYCQACWSRPRKPFPYFTPDSSTMMMNSLQKAAFGANKRHVKRPSISLSQPRGIITLHSG